MALKRSYGAALAFAGLAVAATVRADDVPVYSGDETVVTGARVPQRLSNALQSTTVITAQDIEQSGQQSLPQVLQRLGGLEIATNGGAGQPSAVFIRGANNANTLVLVDGMRVSSATSGTTAYENIPLDQIDHIEIVAGPLSSLYGSDAIGGVIQIFTKNGRTSPRYALSAGYGTWNTTKVNGSFNQSANNFDVAVAAGYSYSNQFDATKSTIPFNQHNPDNDPYENANVSAKLAYHFSPENEAGIAGFYSNGRAHFDNGLLTDDLNNQKLYTLAAYSKNQITPVWQSLLRVGQGTDDIVTSGQFPGKFETNQNQATWQNTFKLWGGSLIAGAEYLRQKVTSDVAYAQTSRTISSVFAGYAGDFGSNGIQANVRYDDNSQFGSHTTGSLGYGYRVSDNLRLRATAGTAFHAPTFNDLYFPDAGNPNLQPEESKSWDAGFDWEGSGQRFSATYFQNRITDLIVFDLNTFLPENLATARIRGGEFAWQGTVLDTQFQAKLTVQNPENDANGAQLPRRAKQFGAIGASHIWQQWKFGVDVVASGPRFDTADENPAGRMGGYALINLFASYVLAPGWSVELRWDNAANKQYELAQGYNTPGSNVFVWLRWAPSQ
jgi:vitamin B12 transporter